MVIRSSDFTMLAQSPRGKNRRGEVGWWQTPLSAHVIIHKDAGSSLQSPRMGESFPRSGEAVP